MFSEFTMVIEATYVCHKRLTRFEEYVKMLKISPMEVEDKSVEVKLITGILILKFLINSQL